MSNNIAISTRGSRGDPGPTGPTGSNGNTGPTGPAGGLSDHDHTGIGDGGILTNDVHDGYSEYQNISVPAAPAVGISRLYAQDQNGFSTLNHIESTNSSLRVCRDSVFVTKVDEAGGVTKGQAVYLSGAVGANELIKLARADSSTTMPAIGIVLDNAAFNARTRVMMLGKLESIDTSGFTEGDRIFVSATTAGLLTVTPPTHPNLRQQVGTVIRSHANNGEIIVAPFILRGDQVGTLSDTWTVGPSLTSRYILSANALTDSRTFTFPNSDGQIVISTDSRLTNPLASASVTGYASFNPSDFTVGTTGHVSLTTDIPRKSTTNTFSQLQTFSSGLSAANLFVSGGATFNSNVTMYGDTISVGNSSTDVVVLASGQKILSVTTTTVSTSQITLYSSNILVDTGYACADVIVQAERYDPVLGTKGVHSVRMRIVSNPAGTLSTASIYGEVKTPSAVAVFTVDDDGSSTWRIRATPSSTENTIFRTLIIGSNVLGVAV